MNRRQWMNQASQHAASLAWASLFASHTTTHAQTPTWRSPDDIFTLGVASGEPRPSSVVLWTRLAPQPLQAGGGMPDHSITVDWEIAHDDRFRHIAQRGSVNTDADRAHSVHVEVHGLDSDHHYFYRFVAGGQNSPIGRTRTAPALTSSPKRLRIALAACQHYETGHFAVHREIANSDVDLVLFVGDYIYLYDESAPWRVRQHPHQVSDDRTLLDYRLQHASYKLDADLRASHAAHPWLLMWDDQEIRNDYDGWTDPEGEWNPAQFLAVRERAYRAYFEHLPVSPKRMPRGLGMAMFNAVQWGSLAQIVLLDTRQYRSPLPCSDPFRAPKGRVVWHCPELHAPEQSMLGAVQERWLSQWLAQSTQRWQLITQTTQISPAYLQLPGEPLRYGDGWDAYPGARDRLMDAIGQASVRNAICLGGDVHRHVAAQLRRRPDDPRSPIIASEFVTSSISSKGLSELMNDLLLHGNPDMRHCRSDERGYTLLELDDEQLTCTFRATRHPVAKQASLHTQARFVVQDGIPGPKRMA